MDMNLPPQDQGDRLRQLRAFCHTARLGGMTRAAAHIGSSQASVSRQIHLLERELAVKLLERRGPSIATTPVGRRLYRRAMPLVMAIDRLPDTFAEQHYKRVEGPLTIAAGQSSATFIVPEYLKRFRESYPDIPVNVTTGTGRERLGWLRSYQTDIAFGSMALEPPDMAFRFLFNSRLVLVTPEDHPLAGRSSVALHETSQWSLIHHLPGSVSRRNADLYTQLRGIPIRPTVEVNGWTAIKHYVEAGLGVAVVPELCLDEQDRVCRVPVDPPLPTLKYGFYTRRNDVLSEASRRFIRLLEQGSSVEARR